MFKSLNAVSKSFFILFLLFLFTRLYNITLLPIFTDEAVYVYWAKYIATYHSNWFISLTDGNPPLFTWIAAFLLKIFPSSMYLFAARLVSVIAGLIGLIGIYKLSNLLFKNKLTGFFAGFLYIINPFILFYDRLALFDSLLSSMLIWSAYYAIRTSKTLAKKHALLWGIFLGLGLLTKSSAVIFLVLTPICFILFLDKSEIKRIIFLFFFAATVAFILQSIQIISPLYQSIPDKTAHFQIPINILFKNPFFAFGKNMQEVYKWLVSYYTYPVLLIGCISLLFLLKTDIKKGSAVLLWIIPILGFATIGKILFPRYILFTTPYFILVLSYGLSFLSSKKDLRAISILVISVIIFFSLRVDWLMLTNPSKAPLPPIDYSQYISDKNSGYGLNEVFSFLDKELYTGPQITLMTQGEFGLFPYAFKLRYWDDKRIHFFTEKLSGKQDITALQKSSRVYVVFWENESIPTDFPFREVFRGVKPGGKHPIILAVPKEKNE